MYLSPLIKEAKYKNDLLIIQKKDFYLHEKIMKQKKILKRNQAFLL